MRFKSFVLPLLFLIIGVWLGLGLYKFYNKEPSFSKTKITGYVVGLEFQDNFPGYSEIVGVTNSKGQYIQVLIEGKNVGGNVNDESINSGKTVKLNDKVEVSGGLNVNNVEGRILRSMVVSEKNDYIKILPKK